MRAAQHNPRLEKSQMASKRASGSSRPSRRVVGLRVRGRVYRTVLAPDRRVGGYSVQVPELPGCISEGDSLVEAKRMARSAIEAWLSVAKSK
jgi:predicted RNase H-like HicB family nuclease